MLRKMPNSQRSLTLRYGCAVVSIALATWGRFLLDPILGNQFPYATLFFAVMLTSAYGGTGPAIAAVLLGAFSSTYFLLTPHGLNGWDQYAGMAVYLLTSLSIALLGGAMRTARFRAEASAQATERQAALIDLAYDAVLTWDWNGPITFWNRGAELLYGFSRSEALARVSHELLRTKNSGGVQAFIDALDREGSWEGELEHTARDGRQVTVESRMVLVRDAGSAYVLETNRDITHRKRAEAALREEKDRLETRVRERTVQANEQLRVAEERLRQMVAGVRDYAILMLDPLGNVVSWNASAERIKGFRDDEIIGQHFSRFYPPEEVAAGKPERELKMAIADGRCQDEGWRLRKDGSRFWANVLITPIYDDKGQLRGFSKVTRDMTQPRREEAALQESQARMGGIVNSAMDAIISIDGEQHIVLFNAAAERMFRCPAADAMGQSIGTFIPARFRDGHRLHVKEFAAAGIASRSMSPLGAIKALRADGEEFPIEASISQLQVAGQKLYTVILRDITERERVEQALRKSEAHLQTIVENLDEGVIVASLDGQLLHWNRAALHLLGFASMEECLRLLPDFADTYELSGVDGAILSVDQWPLARILRGETLRDLEVGVRRIEDDWQRVFSHGGTLVHDPNGEPLLAVLTIRDVTEQKRHAEQILQLNAELEERVVERTAQLEAANQELEAFSYSVSHDLRAPLRAVDGFSEALLEDYGPHLPEEGQRYLKTIREGAQRMGDLIDDLLTFARLSRQPLKKREVDTGDLVRDTLEELNSQQAGRRIDVRVGDLAPCQGDQALLKQVWVNLLSNALKYTRERETALVEVGCVRENGETVYFVRDNGTGFDMRYAHKLFGVFQRLHRAEEFEGTGVGLAIVQRVIHRHGGRVWAEAQVDRGATFYFTLEGES